VKTELRQSVLVRFESFPLTISLRRRLRFGAWIHRRWVVLLLVDHQLQQQLHPVLKVWMAWRWLDVWCKQLKQLP
jgi:hypothetical protein